MATFGAIQTAVSSRLLDPDNTAVSAADVAASINDAVRYWKFKRFWFNEGYSQTTTVPQTGPFPLPTDFLVPATDNDGFNIEYSSMRYPLKKLVQMQYDNIYLTSGYGLPRMYARVGQDYVLYPLPDRAYDINCHYLRDYADMIGPNDTNDFTDNAERLLTLWACADLVFEIRRDQEAEMKFRDRAMKEYAELQNMTRKSNASGSLVLSSTLLQ